MARKRRKTHWGTWPWYPEEGAVAPREYGPQWPATLFIMESLVVSYMYMYNDMLNIVSRV